MKPVIEKEMLSAEQGLDISVLSKTVDSKVSSLSLQTCKTYNAHVIKLSRKLKKNKCLNLFLYHLLTLSKFVNSTL